MEKVTINLTEPYLEPGLTLLSGIRSNVELWTGFTEVSIYSGQQDLLLTLRRPSAEGANEEAI